MNKDKILHNIEILFINNTFNNVSMQDIANMLEIKKSSLYYYFSSKEVMLKEVITYSYNNFYDFIKKLLFSFEKEKFKELFLDFLDFMENQKNLFSIINQNWYNFNDNIDNLIQDYQKELFELVYDNLKEKLVLNKEKTFLFLSLIQDVYRKKTIYKKCLLDRNSVIEEIKNLFIN